MRLYHYSESNLAPPQHREEQESQPPSQEQDTNSQALSQEQETNSQSSQSPSEEQETTSLSSGQQRATVTTSRQGPTQPNPTQRSSTQPKRVLPGSKRKRNDYSHVLEHIDSELAAIDTDSTNEEDEAYHFAQTIVHPLRRLNKYKFALAKKRIDDVLFDLEFTDMSQSQRSSPFSPPPHLGTSYAQSPPQPGTSYAQPDTDTYRITQLQ